MCLGNYRRSLSLTNYYCVPYSMGCSEVIVIGNFLYTYLIRISIRGLEVSTGHRCLGSNSGGNMRLGGLKNCIDCIDFCLSVCRSFSNRKPIFYYYLASELDVPTFCWFPWADIPSATISFPYLRDPVLFSLRFSKNSSNLSLVFKSFFGMF